jgi:transcriptional regulator with XRE-family HTH domain
MTLFADHLRQARQRKRMPSGQRMTQGDLAQLVGVERNTVSRWENSGVLGVSMEWLVGVNDEVVDHGSPRRVAESPASSYAARPDSDPLLPLPIYQAMHGYRARLQTAGCSADQTQEAERLLLDSAQNRLRTTAARARPVQAMLDDLEAAWAYITHVLGAEGISV